VTEQVKDDVMRDAQVWYKLFCRKGGMTMKSARLAFRVRHVVRGEDGRLKRVKKRLRHGNQPWHQSGVQNYLQNGMERNMHRIHINRILQNRTKS
jgi:hypothetical protein